MPNPLLCLTVNCRRATQHKAEKARSDAIDRQLEEDSQRLKSKKQILLLGSRGSEKSSIIQQMKYMDHNGFHDAERMDYRQNIYKCILDSAQTIVLSVRKFGYDYVDPNNYFNADHILGYRVDSSLEPVFSSEIAQAIHKLWRDPIIPQLMDHGSEFYLMDGAEYFLADVLRIAAPDYLPTDRDILKLYPKTGITETRILMGNLQVSVIDVGEQRTERKKWMHCFENVSGIIFCAALSDYDQVLLEDESQNQLAESFALFDSIINSGWFTKTSINLFLTKVDEFKTKLPKVPLQRYFPDYSGGADANKAVKYILWRFMQRNRDHLTIYPHLVQLTDTNNVRLVFAAVQRAMLRDALGVLDLNAL